APGRVRKAQCDRGAAKDIALQGDLSAMQLDDRLDDGQAEPTSPRVRRPRRIDAIEAVEDTLQMLRRYPATIVADDDLGVGIAFANLDDDRPAGGRVFHGVGHEIDESPAQQRAFRADPTLTLAADCNALLFRDLIEEGFDAFDHVSGVQPASADL